MPAAEFCALGAAETPGAVVCAIAVGPDSASASAARLTIHLMTSSSFGIDPGGGAQLSASMAANVRLGCSFLALMKRGGRYSLLSLHLLPSGRNRPPWTAHGAWPTFKLCPMRLA